MINEANSISYKSGNISDLRKELKAQNSRKLSELVISLIHTEEYWSKLGNAYGFILKDRKQLQQIDCQEIEDIQFQMVDE